jgi:outer membrane protein assembly factor BamE (lipoprotein component of BamABCDE complex)
MKTWIVVFSVTTSKCAELKSGATAAQVQSTLGEPLHIRRDGDVETWEYFVRVLEADGRKFLGFVPMPDAKTPWSASSTVKLDRGVVVELVCPR